MISKRLLKIWKQAIKMNETKEIRNLKDLNRLIPGDRFRVFNRGEEREFTVDENVNGYFSFMRFCNSEQIKPGFTPIKSFKIEKDKLNYYNGVVLIGEGLKEEFYFPRKSDYNEHSDYDKKAELILNNQK